MSSYFLMGMPGHGKTGCCRKERGRGSGVREELQGKRHE